MSAVNRTPLTNDEPKTRRVRVGVEDRSAGLGVARLGILLKEVLQLIPDEAALKLMDDYDEGATIVLSLRKNSRGIEYKTQFSWRTEPDTTVMREHVEIDLVEGP